MKHPGTIDVKVLHLMISCALSFLFASLPQPSFYVLSASKELCVAAGQQIIGSIPVKSDLTEVQQSCSCQRRDRRL